MEIKNYPEELAKLIRSSQTNARISAQMHNYHDKDIAEALESFNRHERDRLYQILSPERMAPVFSYLDDPTPYLAELTPKAAAAIIEEMDSDDAVDALERLDETKRQKLIDLMNRESSDDIKLICSYEDDEIGSRMTTNYVEISRSLTVKAAMRSLIGQAEDNDNITTIYVSEEDGTFYGAIDLKDLIVAREYVELESLISRSYPYVIAHEQVADCIERLKEYAEDSIPVLDDDRKLIGVITSQNIIEAVDDEMGDDYAKLGGLTSEEDLNETLAVSIKKRLPWLIILLFLGMGVSTVVGLFENVVAHVVLIVCFQSLILDMAGNVGTQSLAVTIRVLMDERIKPAQKLRLVWKETRIGFYNGLLLGVLAFVFIGLYVLLFKGKELVYSFAISGCVGVSLLAAMVISSMVGTLVPLFFHKIKVDPAVASGPLITTITDLVAVVTYYGITWVFLINLLKLV